MNDATSDRIVQTCPWPLDRPRTRRGALPQCHATAASAPGAHLPRSTQSGARRSAPHRVDQKSSKSRFHGTYVSLGIAQIW